MSVPFGVGQTVDTVDFVAEVRTLTEDARPKTVAFHFRRPLEDPRYRWLETQATGVVAWTPPAIGETVFLELVLPQL